MNRDELTRKALDGELSPSEETELLKLLDSDPEFKTTFLNLTRIDTTLEKYLDQRDQFKQSVLQQIEFLDHRDQFKANLLSEIQDISPRKATTNSQLSMMRMAAILILGIGIGFFINQPENTHKTEPAIALQLEQRQVEQPVALAEATTAMPQKQEVLTLYNVDLPTHKIAHFKANKKIIFKGSSQFKAGTRFIAKVN